METPITQEDDNYCSKQWEDGPGDKIEQKTHKQREQHQAQDDQADLLVARVAPHRLFWSLTLIVMKP